MINGDKANVNCKERTDKPTKPPVAAKPDLLTSTPAAPTAAMPYTSPSSSSSHSPAHALPTSVTASPSAKPLYSGALSSTGTASNRVGEKPTATVSAMTAHVSDSITTTAAKSSRQDRVVPSSSAETAISSPGKQQNINSTVTGGTGAVTQTVYRVQTPISQGTDADISTYQVCGPVNPVIPSATKASSLPGAGSSHSNLYGSPPGAVTDMGVRDSFEKPRSALNGISPCRPCLSSSSSSPPTSPIESSSHVAKKPSVTFADTTSTIPSSPSLNSPPGHQAHPNDSSEAALDNKQPIVEKADLATQKQAARNAFFSSLSTPPVSPASPSDRSSAILDPGPVLSPSPGVVGKVTPGSTINLVLAGSASPKSTSHPGTFTISPPSDIILPSGSASSQTSEQPKKFFIASSPSPKKSPTLIPSRQASLDSQLPPEGTAPLASVDTSSSSSESEYSGAKPKKVPPPPPPRRGSRPTSFSGVPGYSNNSSPTHNSGEMPRFVGGVLGQHRLSGGPLSSTPKSGNYESKPAVSIFQKDIASGIYANMNRPDLQDQKSTPQQIMIEAGAGKTNGANAQYQQRSAADERASNGNVPSYQDQYEHSPPIPPPPSATLGPTNRQERGSSSESTSSSETSMGSQQSVVNVVRAQSMHCSPSGGSGRHGSKPAPPKRQSSLLAKFTGSSKGGSNCDGKGVDL